ncbi:MAG: acyl-CoA thioesterase [Legionellales bacterium RIFCSPHIGHO2_12_FULL_35_11]|nr:MAG: acyl-CoA thioesterase [Legionellales bacterium RIFCSPHIGHO2_12_FULL_35_11]
MTNITYGELTIQTLAMPNTTNPAGDIFGGWIVSQMDLACGVLAKRISKGRAVTVAIKSMTFYKPVHVGNLVSCYVKPEVIGTTSMTFGVEVWTEALTIDARKEKVTKGEFVFVAIDEQGNPRKIEK